MILAIVSIRAIKDGGILSKTQTAQKVYSESEEKEKIQLAINQAAIDGMGTINKEPLNTALKEQFGEGNFEITEETEYFKVKIKSSGRMYTINKNGIIDKIEESWKDNGNGTYTKGNETVKIGDKKTSEEVKKALGIEDIKYTENWEVIGVEDDKIKLVSTGNVTSYTLGYRDPEAKAAVAAVDEKSLTEEEKLKRGIYSYVHAVDTLNKVASNATGITDARSVTIEDIYEILDKAECGITDDNRKESNSNYGTEYTYNYANSKDKTFVNERGEIVKIDSAEKEVKLKNTWFTHNLDEKQKGALGSLLNGVYWVASKCVGVDQDDERAYFVVQSIYQNVIGTDNYSECAFHSDGMAWWCGNYGVRAVVYI